MPLSCTGHACRSIICFTPTHAEMSFFGRCCPRNGPNTRPARDSSDRGRNAGGRRDRAGIGARELRPARMASAYQRSGLRSDAVCDAVSLEATDTLLAGSDPMAGTLQKTGSHFMAKLHRLYCRAAEIRGQITKYRIEVRTHGDEAAFRRGSRALPHCHDVRP